jgi:hypothetical protein
VHADDLSVRALNTDPALGRAEGREFFRVSNEVHARCFIYLLEFQPPLTLVPGQLVRMETLEEFRDVAVPNSFQALYATLAELNATLQSMVRGFYLRFLFVLVRHLTPTRSRCPAARG